jgi:excisionase family DNA binding protein
MTKKEACDLLGVAERTLDKYAREGRLTVSQVRGKTGPRNDYDSAELESLKADLEAPQAPQRAFAPLADGDGATGERSSAIVPLRASAPLAQSGPLFVLTPEQLPELARALAGQVEGVVSVADRLTLDLDGAAALSGISRGAIRAAIVAGELSGRKIGRGWRVERSALDEWVKGLFSTKGADGSKAP